MRIVSSLVLFLMGIVTFECALSSVGLADDRRVIVGFHKKPHAIERALVRRNNGVVRRRFRTINALSASMTEHAITKLQNDPRVAYVEEDALVQIVDAEFSSLEYQASWGVARIEAASVHAENIKGAGVKVAVLDTGIDYNHPDLDANYKAGVNYVDISRFQEPMDDHGHGTHVAGILAAELNGAGVVGVAPSVSLYAVKVLNSDGNGRLSDVIAGIEWAVANGMDIVNMSFKTEDSPALADACAQAYESGVLLVAAAGNTGWWGGYVDYPARYPSVIAVGATTANDALYYNSAKGADVDIVAPGTAVYSSMNNGNYGTLTGTSQAAPHVAGVAALILSAGLSDLNFDGIRNNKDLRLQVYNAAFDLGVPGKDDIYGFGLVNAQAATVENLEWLRRQRSDRDHDGIADSVDNCKYRYNPAQLDHDGDGISNVCDIYNSRATKMSGRALQSKNLRTGARRFLR